MIIPAAGRSERFGAEKLAITVAGRSLLEHSIRAFINRRDVACVLVALRDLASPPPITQELERDPRLTFYQGGEHRASTVQIGVATLAKVHGSAAFVAIHDAARPAVTQELIDRVFDAARRYGAAVPGMPPIDTIKHARGSVVLRTLPRTELVAVQTPQAMRRDWVEQGFANCRIPPEQITDDAQVLELAGRQVRVVEGDERNLKVTVPADLARINTFLSERPA